MRNNQEFSSSILPFAQPSPTSILLSLFTYLFFLFIISISLSSLLPYFLSPLTPLLLLSHLSFLSLLSLSSLSFLPSPLFPLSPLSSLYICSILFPLGLSISIILSKCKSVLHILLCPALKYSPMLKKFI